MQGRGLRGFGRGALRLRRQLAFRRPAEQSHTRLSTVFMLEIELTSKPFERTPNSPQALTLAFVWSLCGEGTIHELRRRRTRKRMESAILFSFKHSQRDANGSLKLEGTTTSCQKDRQMRRWSKALKVASFLFLRWDECTFTTAASSSRPKPAAEPARQQKAKPRFCEAPRH